MLEKIFEEEKKPLIASHSNGHIQAINLAATLLEGMTLSEELEEFLTLPAYRHLHD